jgi:hypothetical protein
MLKSKILIYKILSKKLQHLYDIFLVLDKIERYAGLIRTLNTANKVELLINLFFRW